jgi:two-component system, NtrC family, response regulator AtoC
VETEINTARMLLVSKDPSTVRSFAKVGEANDWQMETAHTGLEALEFVQSATSPDLVLLDLVPDDTDSLHTLRWLRRVCPRVPVILISQSENHHDMVEALRLGAQDFLLKPWQEQQLDRILKSHLAGANHPEGVVLGEEIERISDNLSFVAASPAMKKLRAQAELLAQVNVSVLIIGEQGSGKETIARLIHELSVRSGMRFLKVSCDALTDEQLETELFGFAADEVNRGGYYRPGKFELCQRGTLLLEEITEMSPVLQAKVVAALQRSRVVKKNNNERADLDVRILATSKADPEAAEIEGKMNGDLLNRLSAFTLSVPPLRQRKEDIPILLGHFMKRLARHYGLPTRNLSAQAMEGCQRYSWPGNVEELENFVKGYLMLGDDSLLMLGAGSLCAGSAQPSMEAAIQTRIESLKPEASDGNGTAPRAPATQPESLKSLIRSVKEEAEKSAIAGALDRTHWNRKAAARLLQISYRALLYKIEQHQMRPPQFADASRQSE